MNKELWVRGESGGGFGGGGEAPLKEEGADGGDRIKSV